MSLKDDIQTVARFLDKQRGELMPEPLVFMRLRAALARCGGAE